MNTSEQTRYYPKNTDLRFVMLTREQETDLFRKARGGDAQSGDFLIKNHLLFAARQGRQMVRGKLPDDDVVSAANFAVMKAFQRFDYTLGHRFTSYLKPFIKGEIATLWKNLASVRVPANTPHPPEDKPVKPAEPTTQPHHEIESSEHIEYLQAILVQNQDCLNEHERKILRLVYTDGQTFADIARTNGVTRSAIQASHARALIKLKRAFKRQGIEGTR